MILFCCLFILSIALSTMLAKIELMVEEQRAYASPCEMLFQFPATPCPGKYFFFARGAATVWLCIAPLLSRWIYYCWEIFLLSHFLSSPSQSSLSPPKCGRILLEIHQIARHKTSTSINLADWLAVACFNSQSRLGMVDRNAWCISRNAWRYLVFWGPAMERLHSLHANQLPGKMEAFMWGPLASVISHLWEEVGKEKCSARRKGSRVPANPSSDLFAQMPTWGDSAACLRSTSRGQYQK